VTAVQASVRAGDEDLAQGKFDDAIADYRRALELDPYNAQVRGILSQATKACNKEKSIRNKKLNCGASEPDIPVPDPRKAKAKVNIGDFHLRRGEYADAAASYREGLKLDPFNADIPQKIALAIRECKEENNVMGEHLNCDEPKPATLRPNPAPSTHQP
jgi:tetratricopeptide (TPR) repeat protein